MGEFLNPNIPRYDKALPNLTALTYIFIRDAKFRVSGWGNCLQRGIKKGLSGEHPAMIKAGRMHAAAVEDLIMLIESAHGIQFENPRGIKHE